MKHEFSHAAEKLQEICDLLNHCKYEIHYRDDGEYNYLTELDVCITIPSPYSDEKMYLDLDEEFTLSWGAYHEHYSPDVSGYKNMLEMMNGILNNELCSATMYYGETLKWLGSTFITRTESTELPVREIFSFIYKTREFKKKLDTNGGQVHYDFWNPAYNRIIKIDKKK